jgi:hypothetical protein
VGDHYRALNTVLVKKYTTEGKRYKAGEYYPDDAGYFHVNGKKFRNPPFYQGDTTVVEEA